MKTYLVIAKMLIISALLIVSNGNLALIDAHNRELFWDQYYSWLSDFFDKGYYITAYAIQAEWLPDTNSTGSKPFNLSAPDE